MVAGGVDGGDAVGVGVAGLGGLVAEARANDGGGGEACELLRGELAAVDVVAGEVGVGAGLPGEVDGVGGGDGGKAGGGLRGEDVGDLEGDGWGDGAAEFESMAVEGDRADALSGVGVGLALDSGGVEGAPGVGVVFGG